MHTTHNRKNLYTLLIVIAALLLGYWASTMWPFDMKRNPFFGEREVVLPESDMTVMETKRAEGILPPPAELPAEIPVEKLGITESVSVDFPQRDQKQLTVSYVSTKTVAQKYAEYKTYMSQNGYDIVESPATTPVRAIFGQKGEILLSVAVSTSTDGTLVQISYIYPTGN